MIVIFGGGFDPVHIGHIKSANNAINSLELEYLIMLPYYLSPHKKKPMFDSQTRLSLLKKSTKNNNKIIVDDSEIKQKKTNYTIDYLIQKRQQYPQKSIGFLLGTDAFNQIHTWKDYQKLTNLAHLIIVNRPHCTINKKQCQQFNKTTNINTLKQHKNGFIYQLMQEEIDISSSDIRHKINHNKSIKIKNSKTA